MGYFIFMFLCYVCQLLQHEFNDNDVLLTMPYYISLQSLNSNTFIYFSLAFAYWPFENSHRSYPKGIKATPH